MAAALRQCGARQCRVPALQLFAGACGSGLKRLGRLRECLYIYIYIYICLFLSLFACLLVCLFGWLFVCLFVCLFVSLFLFCFFVLFVCLFVCLFVGLCLQGSGCCHNDSLGSWFHATAPLRARVPELTVRTASFAEGEQRV